jgi:hypothetical protein
MMPMLIPVVATVVCVGYGVRVIRRSGWSSRRAALGWLGILVGLYGAFVALQFARAASVGEIATTIAFGLLLGLGVLFVSARWPQI